MTNQKDNVIVFNTNGLGSSDDQSLKDKLVKTYLTLLLKMRPLPVAICFYTESVKSACDGFPVLDELSALESSGVRLILCQTCLKPYGLNDNVRVGLVGGMGDIMTAMGQADSVITL